MSKKNNSKKSDDFNWETNTWDIIDTFFKQENIMIEHHLSSFNHFMTHDLQSIVREKDFNPIKIYNKDSWNEELQQYLETYQIEFGKIYISKPVLYDAPNKPMYPAEARLRKLTYGANLYIDIQHRTVKIDPASGEQEIIQYDTLEKYPCGRMPIMVGSKYCVLSEQNNMTKTEMGEGEYDYGGYFIIKGSEKVIICQEKKCENKICCFKNKSTQNKYSETAEISCIQPDNPSSISPVYVKMKSKEESSGGNAIRIRLKRMKQDIPLIIIFRALNFISDKSIVELIVFDINNENNNALMDLLKASIEEARPIQTQKIALEYISKYITGIQTIKYKTNKCKLKYAFDVLCTELFPHVGPSLTKKAYFLGYMVNKLLKCHLGTTKYDDRDSFLNKRVETSGDLMAQLFRAYFGKFVKELKTTCDKDMMAGRLAELPQNLSKKLKPNSIENDIKYALGTGNWGLKSQAKPRKGIAAVLQRLTYIGTLSNLRRIVAPIDKNGKLTDPRKLHCTQWGVICPFETPEGGSVGIVKNMAMTCQITIPCNAEPLKACLDEFGVVCLESVNPISITESVKVFVNGDWYGQSFEPHILIQKLKSLRRQGLLNPYISIAWYIQYNEVQIWTDGGRLCRPLYIIRDNKFVIDNTFVQEIVEKKMQWKDILIKPLQSNIENSNDLDDMSEDNAVIEYIDVNESDTLMIAMSNDNLVENDRNNYSYYKYTHCEIHPSLIVGVLACNIPFPDHNQAPRNLYQGAMGKQSMGIYSTAFRSRMDTMAHILHYPQKPMVNTQTSKYVHSDTLPSGQMPIVAIACYTGYNQEDSLIFNQSAIDRGLFSSSFYRTYMDEEKKNSATLEDEKFCKPQKYYANGKIYTEKMSHGSYDKLDENGIAIVNSFVDGNDIIIGKVTMLKDSIEGEPKARDLSTSLRSNESGIVDKVYKNSNGDGYNFVKVRVRSDRIPEVGDKFACFDQFTDVLTNKGWKKIIDVNKSDLVCILDPKTDNISYETPEEIHCYPYNGKMYKLRSQLVDLTVTPNHRMWIKRRFGKGSNYKENFEFMNAEDCFGRRLKYKKTVQNYQPKDWIGETFTIPEFIDKNEKIRPEKIILMNDWLVFFGIWMAEGCSDKNYIRIAAHKPRVKKALEPVINNFGYHICKSGKDVDINGEKNCWSFGDVQLASVMEPLSVGAINKFLPDWVWRLNKEQSRLLIESMMLGDGYVNKSNANLYYTSSERLADDFCRLCLHAGYSSHKRLHAGRVAGSQATKKDGEVITSTADNYTITVIKTKLEPEINHGHHKEQDGQSEEWEHYEGTVHCLTVRTGIFMVRENGKPVWTGNSRHGQKGTIGLTYKQEDMPFTKDGVVPDIIMNPNAIPKRMTIAQLIECVFGKVGTIAGCELDATPFRKVTVENISEVMEKLGYKGAGTEVLYNGKTGEQMTASIFIGPTFYYRLKHLVEDKLHSRSTGPYQLLTLQPAEGRSRDGGFRFGEMERDCKLEGTRISLASGLSIKIENMKNCNWEVLGWSEKHDGMVKALQSDFLYKGERECVELMLEDGRKVSCTENHPLLTIDNKWIHAKDLEIGITKLKTSVTYPVMDIHDEINECNGWELMVGNINLQTNTEKELLKTMAFVRILGYLITDGHIYHNAKENKVGAIIFLGHMIDVNTLLDDLRLFCPIVQKNWNEKKLYKVRIPAAFVREILKLEGIITGRKITQAAELPNFIVESNCPKPIIREFLGGMFGGDGHTCLLGMHRGKRDILSSVSISMSKTNEHLESLKNMFEQMKSLFAKFGIEKVSIQNFKETTSSKNKDVSQSKRKYQLTLHLEIDELIPFSEKIGFRYCCHKSQRLEAGVSYRRLRNKVISQHNWIVERVDQLTNFSKIKAENPKKNIPTKDAIIKAVEELELTEALIHEYAIPSTHDINDHLVKGTKFSKFSSKSFPTAEEYLKEIGALDWFLTEEKQESEKDKEKLLEDEEEITDEQEQEQKEEEGEEEPPKSPSANVSYGVNRKLESLPTMNLKVLSRIPIGPKPVYDIQVDEVHSFLANGVVSHNCMLSHGSVQFLKERTFDCSDKYVVWIDKDTGTIAPINEEKGIYKSLYSDNTTRFAKVQIPYSSKLLIQELTSMHILPRIFTK